MSPRLRKARSGSVLRVRIEFFGDEGPVVREFQLAPTSRFELTVEALDKEDPFHTFRLFTPGKKFLLIEGEIL